MLGKVLEGEGGRDVIGAIVGGKSMEVLKEKGREALTEVSDEALLKGREKRVVLVVVLVVVMILEVQVWEGIGLEREGNEVLEEKMVVKEEKEGRVVDGMVLKEELRMIRVVLMEMRVTKVVVEVVRYSSSE